jgi:Raf kinase inhibitor-like YbhB/YbcL family protein
MTSRRSPLRPLVLLLGFLCLGCPAPEKTGGAGEKTASSPSGADAGETLTVTSAAFEAGQRVPTRHAYQGEGDNVSPPLAWSGVPTEARELVLLCDDPDAPRDEPWVHWVVYGIAPDASGSAEGGVPAGGVLGTTDWQEQGWGGPMPPEGHGTHHYHFRLYALDAPLGLGPGKTKAEVLAAMEGHVLAEGELIGTYSR